MTKFVPLPYTEAIRHVQNGNVVILLPENANPGYLAVCGQPYHPMAAVLTKGDNYRDTVGNYAFAKSYVLSDFDGDAGLVSKTRVTAWLVETPIKPF